jgi:DNA repair protein RecO (recombination protein O)
MTRHKVFSALVLRVRDCGESNREASFLTAEEGIIYAFLYGGPKSSLRAHVSPFNRGALYLYHDPIRNSYKVTDFDVQSWKPGIRELYERTEAAFAIAETILAGSGGGGEWAETYSLADGILEALNDAPPELSRRLRSYFLWKWTAALGVQPDMTDYALPLSAASRRYLSALNRTDAASLSRCTCSPETEQETHIFVTGLLSAIMGRRLPCWE